MRIAFHAPMKPPDHPVPSGDRAMARALMTALAAGGHAVELASTLRTWCATSDPEAMRIVETAAEQEAERLAAEWAAGGAPDLWFTYHSYYRAPDLIGPRLAARLGLPYVLAEASQAAKRAEGPWARWHGVNECAIRAAAVHVCFTERDAKGLAGSVEPERIMMLPPFLAVDRASGRAASRVARTSPRDPDPHPRPLSTRKRGEPRRRTAGEPVRLVTAAMMRPGKVRSYAILAEALAALPGEIDWCLAVAGDGPERAAVELAFAILPPDRIVWHGALPADTLSVLFAEADLFTWPGFNEPFGVAYLEAQAAGLPVLAMESGGVTSVVEHGRTGLLVPEGNVHAYAAALARLMTEEDLRWRLGREGRRVVLEERTVARAAGILNAALDRARAVPA